MNIGILGSGVVGQTLGAAFMQEKHQVMLGSRDTTKKEVQEWLQKNPGATIGNFDVVAKFADIIILAVSGASAMNALQISGGENLNGKIIIDVTNPLAATPPENGVLSFFTGANESLMEKLQTAFPGAKFVKAFNSVGSALMYKPSFEGMVPTMFICGNDAEAKNTVTGILTDFGWETEDMGSVTSARAIEPLCILWCIPGFLQNHWQHAFKLLKK